MLIKKHFSLQSSRDVCILKLFSVLFFHSHQDVNDKHPNMIKTRGMIWCKAEQSSTRKPAIHLWSYERPCTLSSPTWIQMGKHDPPPPVSSRSFKSAVSHLSFFSFFYFFYLLYNIVGVAIWLQCCAAVQLLFCVFDLKYLLVKITSVCRCTSR